MQSRPSPFCTEAGACVRKILRPGYPFCPASGIYSPVFRAGRRLIARGSSCRVDDPTGAIENELSGASLSAEPEAREPTDVVLLCAPPDVSRAVQQALRGTDLPIRLVEASRDALFECEPASLYILSHDVDTTGGTETIRAIAGRMFAPARVVVLFPDAADRRRSWVTAVGGYDYVLSPDGDLGPLLALVDRVLTRNTLEARLEAAMRQVRALVEHSNDGVYILSTDRFVYVNPRFEEMVGYTLEELLAESFDLNVIIDPASRGVIAERGHRVQAGLPVEPRYDFVALHRDGARFDAQVSVSYIDFDGQPATLGIMQDITERKRFEQQLLRKNRELALLNELAASINNAVNLDDTLLIGCRRATALLGFAAAGITLFTSDRRFLALRVSEGLEGPLTHAIGYLPADSKSLLARAVQSGEVQVVADIRADPRIQLPVVRETSFTGCAVVPLKARDRTLGGAFFFTREGHVPNDQDRDLLRSLGNLLGTAIEKAALLEKERSALRRMQALDEIALTIASSLAVHDVAHAVARSVRTLFDPERIMISRYLAEAGEFVPLCALHGDQVAETRVLHQRETLMEMAVQTRKPVHRISPKSPRGPRDVGNLPVWERDIFALGYGAIVAVPVLEGGDGEPVACLHLTYQTDLPLTTEDLDALSSLSTHFAIAMKNADLFEGRHRALEDLRAAQEQLVQAERLNALGELAAGVAHDFNNVLGAILGRAEILVRTLAEPELKKHVEVIETAARDGAETVRRIQEIGRQESTDDFVPVNLTQILVDVGEITVPRWRDRPREEGRPIDLVVEPLSDDAPLVLGNPHEIREVLINLVHNAVDAMPSGGTIRLSAESCAGPPASFQIHVQDSGTGMPEEVRTRIFDPFFTTKGERGTGLGLSVSYSIIKRHQGDIEVRSTTSGAHRGTTFIVSLPRFQGPLPVEARRPEVAAPSVPRPARVLVIDDEENIREILSDILMTGDHEVVTAHDGPTGLGMIETQRFDLVFTDLGLPGMSGYEVATAIKARQPDLPVGLVTGWGANLDPDLAKHHGVDLVLSKPFRFDQVLQLVDDVLAARGR